MFWNPETAEARPPQGIYVTRVYRNSDAAAKGISEGDIITAINGVSVTTMEQLNRVKNQFTAGQTITLTIYHGGVSSDVESHSHGPRKRIIAQNTPTALPAPWALHSVEEALFSYFAQDF